MDIRVVVIENDGIVAVDFGPALYAWHNGGLAPNLGHFLDAPDKLGPDEALVDKFVARLEPTFGKPLCHPCRGTGAAGRPVDSFVPIEDGISSGTCRVKGFSRP